MKFALVDGKRMSPQKGQRGVCQHCGSELIAKCGRVRMWHWAHKPRPNCDPWWQPETEWHRNWKNQFPEDWQEIVQFDPQSGAKHIADIKTSSGLVIEFQHSPIDYTEARERELFYKNMLWVVDGDAGTLNPAVFQLGMHAIVEFRPEVYCVKWWGRSRLLQRWAEMTKPVYIDFGRTYLWRFWGYSPEENAGYFSRLERAWLVDACKSKSETLVSHISPVDEARMLKMERVYRPSI